MVSDVASTALAAGVALIVAWKLGPALGRWSVGRRWARFVVGLLTELRMLPVLVSLVPLVEASAQVPSFLVVGLLGGASRTAAVARFLSRSELALGPGPDYVHPRLAPLELSRVGGAARAVLLLTVPEVALLEGLSTFFNQGHGHGLGAELAHGRWMAAVPLVALAWLGSLLLDRPPSRTPRPRSP